MNCHGDHKKSSHNDDHSTGHNTNSHHSNSSHNHSGHNGHGHSHGSLHMIIMIAAIGIAVAYAFFK